MLWVQVTSRNSQTYWSFYSLFCLFKDVIAGFFKTFFSQVDCILYLGYTIKITYYTTFRIIITNLKANPKYTEYDEVEYIVNIMKWNRSQHGDAEGSFWKKLCKAAEGAAPLVNGHCFRTSKED